MRDLLEIQRDLQDTHAALGRMELGLARDLLAEDAKTKMYGSLWLTVKGLRQRQQQLEREFLKVANEIGQDVCSYRLFSGAVRPTIDAFANALGTFQSLF